MKRAKPGVVRNEDSPLSKKKTDMEVVQARKNFVDGFGEVRKDPIKRKKIHRLLDFLEVNRDAYRDYLNLDNIDTETRIRELEAKFNKKKVIPETNLQ
jgi:hypothetical protein